MPNAPEFSIERVPGTRTAVFIGELDLAAFDRALEQLSWVFDEAGSLDLDLSRLTFIDSTGIRLLVRLRKGLADEDEMILRSPPPNVLKVLEAVGMEDLGFRIKS
jgi:anti-anti-sigma factor